MRYRLAYSLSKGDLDPQDSVRGIIELKNGLCFVGVKTSPSRINFCQSPIQ